MKKLLFALLLFPALAWGQTRFYFSASGTADIGTASSPPGNFTAWSDTVVFGGAPLRYALKRVADGSATIGNADDLDAGTTDSCLSMIFISEPLVSQVISGTVKGQMRCLEDNTANNATIAFAIAVVSNNCDTLRGVLLNTSASDNTGATPPEMATTAVNRRFQNSAESASMTLSDIALYNGDRLAVYMGARETRNSTTATYTLHNGSPSATDLAEDDTDTDDDNPWIEFSQSLEFHTDTPAQLPHPCGIHSGDFLWPVGNGDGNDLTACCASANWQNVDDSTCVADSNYANSTTMQWDWYRVRAKDVTAPAVWKRHNVNEQIDAIGVEVCARINHGSSGTLTIELALADSVNARDSVYLGRWTSSTINTDLTFSGYFWNVDSTLYRGVGAPDTNRWFNMKRWDSLSLMGLQVGVGLQVNNTQRRALLKAVKVIVYTSLRDTTIPDSVNADFQVTACSTASTGSFVNFHQSGAANSNINPEKFWAGSGLDSAVDKIYLVHSNDTGKTWTAGDPDKIILRRANDPGLGGEVQNGANLVWDATSGRPDSILAGMMSRSSTANKFVTIHSRSPSHTPGRWGVDGSGDPLSSTDSGHVDSLSRQNRLLAPQNGGQFYQLGDTIWAISIDTATAFSRGPLKWWRSIDNGKTWPDTGYIPTNQLGTNSYDINPKVCSVSTTAFRAVFVRWKDGYPALVSAGWARCSTRALQPSYVQINRWHPSWDSANYASKDSLFRYAWLRDATKRIQTTNDTVIVGALVVAGSIFGSLAAVTIYQNGDPALPIIHAVWMQTPLIRHNTLKSDWTKGVAANTCFNVAEISNNVNSNNANTVITVTSKDTLVYALFTMWKNEAGNDTSVIAWTLNCEGGSGGGKWRGPRPLFMIKSNESLFRYCGTAQYQYNDHRIVALTTRGNGAASTNRAALVAGHIIRPGAYAAAAEGTTAPRRRRIIIQKNFKMGEADEKDTVPDWAGTDLPDWDATEK